MVKILLIVSFLVLVIMGVFDLIILTKNNIDQYHQRIEKIFINN